ncbi:MAG: nitroreductase family protein [Clostridia bacterium]|nr:nitroreductase family protein [Clostridia bacterium]
MELYDCISGRRSIRKFRSDPVPAEKLRRIIDAARMAPSWANKQCCWFIVVTDGAVKEAVAAAVPSRNPGKRALEQAPVIVVCCADPLRSGNVEGKPYYMLDAGIAMEHLVLAAYNEGLGTCWIGLFDEQALKVTLGVPEGVRIVALSPLGLADESPKARRRKSLEEVVWENQWGGDISF